MYAFTDVVRAAFMAAGKLKEDVIKVTIPMRVVKTIGELYPIQIMKEKGVKGWLYDDVHIIAFDDGKKYRGVNRRKLQDQVEKLVKNNNKEFSVKAEEGKLFRGESGEILTFLEAFKHGLDEVFIIVK